MISRQKDIVESTLGSPETVNETKLEILKGKNDLFLCLIFSKPLYCSYSRYSEK